VTGGRIGLIFFVGRFADTTLRSRLYFGRNGSGMIVQRSERTIQRANPPRLAKISMGCPGPLAQGSMEEILTRLD
jgi:hypothetical protein